MIIHGRKTGPVSKSGDRLTLMLLFYIAAVCGWLWEVLVYWGTSGFGGSLTELLVFYRGVLHGPWAPIYGTGGILLVLLYRAVQERKGYFLIAAIAVCTVVEYGTSWILEVFFHARWWDYSGQFLNLHGRICFVSIVGFSLIGLWAVQAVVPVCAGWIQKLTYETRKWLCLLVSLLFFLDVIVSVYKLSIS